MTARDLEQSVLMNPRLRYLWQHSSQDHRPAQVLRRYRERIESLPGQLPLDEAGPIQRALQSIDSEPG